MCVWGGGLTVSDWPAVILEALQEHSHQLTHMRSQAILVNLVTVCGCLWVKTEDSVYLDSMHM